MTAPKITPEVERAAEAALAEDNMLGMFTRAELWDIARAALRSLLPPSKTMRDAAMKAGILLAVEVTDAEVELMLTAAIRAAIGDEAAP